LRVNELTPGGQDNFKIADEGGLIADGVLHRTAETSLSMTSSNYQNSNADLQPVPVLTMQRMLIWALIWILLDTWVS
jgi:hypothetical protein